MMHIETNQSLEQFFAYFAAMGEISAYLPRLSLT